MVDPGTSGPVDRASPGDVAMTCAPEHRLAALMEAITDRSSGGDELGRLAADRALSIHVDPARANLLASVEIEPGMLVLELGAGAGTLTRALGDAGARVTALEPDPVLAGIAVARVADLPDVRVVTAGAEALGTLPSDAMLVVITPPPLASGLEIPEPGTAAFDRLIARAVARIAPGGVLLLAVAHEEARRALIGSGTGDGSLPASAKSRPWPRVALAAALRTAGLGAQAWYGTFPDHVAPRVLAEEALLADPSGRMLAVAFARDPGGLPEPGISLARDPSAALAEAFDAGAELDAAPGLLVLAARSTAALAARRRAGALFLLSNGARGRAWRRARVLEVTDAGWRLRSLRPPAEVRDGPLRGREPETDVIVGRNGEDLLVEALVSTGVASARTRALLTRWWRAATAAMADPDGSGGWQFDVGLRNFVVDVGGTWHHVDRELTLDGAPRLDVMAWRAIAWALIERIRPLGDLPGLSPGTTVRTACHAVVASAGLPSDESTEEAWLTFESDLQARLRPGIEDPSQERAALAWLLDRTIVPLPAADDADDGAGGTDQGDDPADPDEGPGADAPDQPAAGSATGGEPPDDAHLGPLRLDHALAVIEVIPELGSPTAKAAR